MTGSLSFFTAAFSFFRPPEEQVLVLMLDVVPETIHIVPHMLSLLSLMDPCVKSYRQQANPRVL